MTAVLASLAILQSPSPKEVSLLSLGGRIAESVRILPAKTVAPTSSAALEVVGDNVTVDFQKAELLGREDPLIDRESHQGVGLLIKGRRNVTVRNAMIRGYRENIRIEDSENIRIIDCDVSLSRAERLLKDGTPAASFLNLRDLAAWRAYGAGIWIENSKACLVSRCRGTGAQNGVLLAGTSGSTIEGCDFSFNSGWGIGLYQSSDNTVAWNRADFVNRPWGGGWGGDSAGLAVVNASHRNFIVGNSLTHGGDGFFLTDRHNGRWSEERRDFEGASNDNVIAHNDGSWSPNNAFEGTFSRRNLYASNHASDSNYGFWLGYSSDNMVIENDIRRSRSDGVAIEHGQNNRIIGNRILETGAAAIHLWAAGQNAQQHPSIGSVVWDNTIGKAGRAASFEGSTGLTFGQNRLESAPLPEGLAQGGGPMGAIVTGWDKHPAFARVQQILAQRPKEFFFYQERAWPQGGSSGLKPICTRRSDLMASP